MSDTVIVFDGYVAELIRLQAEKLGLTPEAYIISFFKAGCNAPRLNLKPSRCVAFAQRVQCTSLRKQGIKGR